MTVSGIVAEYNPFHNGHLYHVNKTRADGATHIVAVMSGNFVQRGDFAIASKWARAVAAVAAGVDLVVELPSAYSLLSAGGFAESAIYILNSLGCVDNLSFGCEVDDINMIKSIAEFILSDRYSQNLASALNSGVSFPAASEKAITQALGKEYSPFLKLPNTTLAVQYVKSLICLNSKIEPKAVLRLGSEHDSPEICKKYPSALGLRKNICDNDILCVKSQMPDCSFDILSEEFDSLKAPCLYSKMETAVLSRLRAFPAEYFKNIPDVSEGLQNRIFNAVRRASTVDELLNSVKTKRYTHSRIRRIILRSYLTLTSDFSSEPPPYIRVLALNERGREILKAAKKSCGLPIITKPSEIYRLDNPFAVKLFEKETELTDLFFTACPKIAPCGAEFTQKLKI